MILIIPVIEIGKCQERPVPPQPIKCHAIPATLCKLERGSLQVSRVALSEAPEMSGRIDEDR